LGFSRDFSGVLSGSGLVTSLSFGVFGVSFAFSGTICGVSNCFGLTVSGSFTGCVICFTIV